MLPVMWVGFDVNRTSCWKLTFCCDVLLIAHICSSSLVWLIYSMLKAV